MNIGIDGKIFSLDNPTGIVSYSKNIIENLDLHGDNIIYFMPNKEKNRVKLPKTNSKSVNISVLKDFILKNKNSPALFRFIFLDGKYVLKHNNIDTYWATNFIAPLHMPYSTKLVLSIYDLITFKYKDEISHKFINELRNKVITENIYAADKILTISNTVKHEIIEYFDIKTPEKIEVVYPATNHIKRFKLEERVNTINELRTKYGLKARNIILTNYAITPRKNIITLVKAYNELDQKIQHDYALFIVGPKIVEYTETYKELMNESLKNKYGEIIFTGFVSQDELIKIYNSASLFVSTSVSEGFDMPVVQAMSIDIPVVASNIPIHKELLGNLSLYFEPTDYSDLKEKMYSLLYYKGFIIPEMYMFKRYTWQAAALAVNKILH